MFRADWDYWKYIPQTDLYSAVKLSFGIDPRDESEILSIKRILFRDSEAIPEEQINQLHKIATENLYHGLDGSAPESGKSYGFSKVSLSKFAGWALLNKMEIPPELEAMAGAINETQSNASMNSKQHAQTEKTARFNFNKTSSTYPKELDYALQAWHAITTTEGKGKPKARIMVWLKKNASELSNEARGRIATVANWDKSGGATKTDENNLPTN